MPARRKTSNKIISENLPRKQEETEASFLSRRQFLQTAGLASAGLALGARAGDAAPSPPTTPATLFKNAVSFTSPVLCP